jgi:hypothetical protein
MTKLYIVYNLRTEMKKKLKGQMKPKINLRDQKM